MALIKCSECGREISDKASSCPHCGCPIMENQKSEVVSRKIEEIINQVKKKINTLSKKQIVILSAIAIILIGVLIIPSGAKQDKSTLKKRLLAPESLVIYEAYTNSNYGDGGRATLFYFGAQNKGGGISDDWALVYDGDVLFYSNYEEARDDGDNQGILEHGELIEAQFELAIGDEDWKKVNLK